MKVVAGEEGQLKLSFESSREEGAAKIEQVRTREEGVQILGIL